MNKIFYNFFLDDEGEFGEEVYVCYIDSKNQIHERKDKYKRYQKYTKGNVKKFSDKLNNGKQETRRIYVDDELKTIVPTIRGKEDGLYLYVVELEDNRMIADILIQSSWTIDTFHMAALVQSSSVYEWQRNQDKNLKFLSKNLQWAYISKCKQLCQILEFRLDYCHDDPENSSLSLIGMKIILFNEPYAEDKNLLYPLFRSDDVIIGT